MFENCTRFDTCTLFLPNSGEGELNAVPPPPNPGIVVEGSCPAVEVGG